MAQQLQEEGWPLGLQPVNVRIGLVRPRNRHFSGSTSFNTLLSGSPSSVSDSSSSDLDTESTGSFFPDRSTTLGSLIGVPRIVNLPRRSIRASSSSNARETLGSQKNCRPSSKTTWYCFSLCPTDTTDAESVTRNTTVATATTPSLAHFLEVERRAAAANANGHRRSHSSSVLYNQISSDDDYRINQNTLFVNGQIAPPPSATQESSSNAAGINGRFSSNMGGLEFEQRSSTGQFPCMCG